MSERQVIRDSTITNPTPSRPTIRGPLLEPLSGEWLPKHVGRLNSVVFLFLVPELYVEPWACFHEQWVSTSKIRSLVVK